MGKAGSGSKGRGGREPQNDAMRAEAHRRLDQLMDMAESNEDYGTMGVDVHFRAGVIDLVQRRLTGADKPAST